MRSEIPYQLYLRIKSYRRCISFSIYNAIAITDFPTVITFTSGCLAAVSMITFHAFTLYNLVCERTYFQLSCTLGGRASIIELKWSLAKTLLTFCVCLLNLETFVSVVAAVLAWWSGQPMRTLAAGVRLRVVLLWPECLWLHSPLLQSNGDNQSSKSRHTCANVCNVRG